MSEITDAIRSKGHWDVAISADYFDSARVDYGQLESLLEHAVVRLRGWPVPYIDHREPVIRDDEWIGQDVGPRVHQPEAWRFFTSGQFNHLRGFAADWWNREGLAIPGEANAHIEVWEVLFYLTEVFELANRLSLTDAGAEQMRVQVKLYGLRNRALVVAQPNRSEFMTPRIASMESIERSVSLSRDELVAEPRGHAVTLAHDIFLRFGFDASTEQLAGHQAEISR